MHSRPTSTVRILRITGVGALATFALAACGGSSSGGGSATPAGDERHAVVTISEANGCEVSATTFPAGALTFDITNQDADAVTEVELEKDGRIVGEKENLPAGFSGHFTVKVDGGTYELVCPGADPDSVELTVTGSAAVSSGSTAELLDQGATEYAEYVNEQVAELVEATQTLAAAIESGELTDAQTAYYKARPFYEKIEPVAESFAAGKTNLDADIDAREGDVPEAKWRGFHRLEKGLFADKSVAGLSKYAAGLVANVEKLQSLTKDLTFQPFEIANGAQELLDEVAASKITGEEERYSRIDLVDIDSNTEGAEQAFLTLRAGLDRINKQLSSTIAKRFEQLEELIESYRTDDNTSGFVFYDELTKADTHKLAAAVKAVQEPLSQVASKVAKV
jgi:iron uptake system component EfeO